MSLPRIPKAVVFDMDGLLCDTEAVYRDAMSAVLAELGHEMPFSLFHSMVGLPALQSDAKVMGHYGEAFPMGLSGAACGKRWTPPAPRASP